MSNGNKIKYTDVNETYIKFGKNAPNNLKRPKKSSSNDSRHGRKEREIIGESRKLTVKRSDTCRKGAKEASKEKNPSGSQKRKKTSLEKTHLVLKKENWVMYDACEKWRLLPFGMEPSSLPKEWFCQILYWLPDMNRCDISEDSTAQAVNGMYGIQLHQCQVDANKEHLQHPGSMNHSSSISEMNNQSSIKSKSMTDIVQQPLKKVQAGTGRRSHQAIRRNGVAMGMHKFKQQEKWMPKQNASLRAEGNVGQGRHMNEGEPVGHKSLKKTKARVAIDGPYSQLSTVPRESSKVDNLHGALISIVKPLASNIVIERDPVGAVSASSVRREFGQAAGNTVLKEAKDLKHIADRLKARGGSDHDIMRLYFEAALRFLHGASLLEPFNDEIAKHGEIPEPLKLYIDTVRLCEFCASTYERNKEMAVAALTYKCMGVAHMRVLLSKTFSLARDWHELHADFQNAPLGSFGKTFSNGSGKYGRGVSKEPPGVWCDVIICFSSSKQTNKKPLVI